MKKNSAGFSILIALLFTILVSFIGIYLIEYMIPYSRSTRNVENAGRAYYQVASAIEENLLYSFSGGVGSEPSDSLSGISDYSYSTIANGTRIPEIGNGTSDYDRDRNALSFLEPVQLFVGQNRLGAGGPASIQIKIPDFNQNGLSDENFVSPNDDLILWQLASTLTGALSTASGSFITESTVSNDLSYDIWNANGITNDRVSQTFSTYYNAYCRASNECVLQISLIHPIIAGGTQNYNYPYLEYTLDFGTNSIPFQYASVNAVGQSYGFKKEFDISVLKQDTNAAFDFTVFQ